MIPDNCSVCSALSSLASNGARSSTRRCGKQPSTSYHRQPGTILHSADDRPEQPALSAMLHILTYSKQNGYSPCQCPHSYTQQPPDL